MASTDRIIRCRYLRVHNGKRENAECSAIERCDCFELIMDQWDDLNHTSWSVKKLRLPKSLFIVVSDEQEYCDLHLLLPIDLDKIHLPKGPVILPGRVAGSSRVEAPPAAARHEQGAHVFSR
jgi:hypothetical protein